MNGSRLRPKLVSLIVASTLAPFGWSQSTSPPVVSPDYVPKQSQYFSERFYSSSENLPKAADRKSDYICKIYPMRDFFDSEEICNWVADTIPEVVQPGSWKMQDPEQRGTVVYNAKVGVMVIYQTPDAHEEIGEFLANMKTTIRSVDENMRRMPAKQSNVVPAQFSPTAVPATPVAKNDAVGPAGYPIVAPLQQPKHLFHFIIRYEGAGLPSVQEVVKMFSGEMPQNVKNDPDNNGGLNHLLHFIIRYEGDGLIDENVVEFIKAYLKVQSSQSDNDANGPTPPTGKIGCPLTAAVAGVPCAIPSMPSFGLYSGQGYSMPMPPSTDSDVEPVAPVESAARRMPLADEQRMPLADEDEMPFVEDDDLPFIDD